MRIEFLIKHRRVFLYFILLCAHNNENLNWPHCKTHLLNKCIEDVLQNEKIINFSIYIIFERQKV